MKNLLSYGKIYEAKKNSPLFESCMTFNLDDLTVEQLRMIDEMVLTEGKGYLDLVAMKEGWDMEDISEDFDIPEDMTFSEFLKEHFEDFTERDFLNYVSEDLDIESVEDLSEDEVTEYLQMNEGFFKRIGKGIKKIAQKAAPVLKKIGKVVKKALPIIAVAGAIALTAVGIPAGLAIAAKSIGGIAKGAKALKALSGVQKVLKGTKSFKAVAKIASKAKKVKSAFNSLKSVKKINTLANKSKSFKKVLDIAKKGAKKVKDDLLKRGAAALESPDNHRIIGTMAATYHASTEAADELKKAGEVEDENEQGGEEAEG
jgi:hypothetical protein